MSTQRFDVGVKHRFSCGAGRQRFAPPEFPLWPAVPQRKRPVRPAPREGFLRRRLHRRHQGPQVAQDRRGRDRDPVQSRASRRGRRRPARRRRRRHPGADAAQVLRPQGGGTRHHAAGARPLCGRLGVHAARSGMAEGHPGRSMPRRFRRKGLTLLGWREVPHDNSSLGESVKPTEPFHMQVFIGRGPSDQSRGRFRAPALHPAQGHLRRRLSQARAAARELLRRVAVVPHARLQGHVPRRPARQVLSRPARAGFRDRARAGASALLDQHVPELAAGASLPHGRAQRRDQHAARQRQLDGGAPGFGRPRSCSATTSRSCGRSPTRASPTPRASTTRSNSWCRAATRSRTPP